MKLGLGDANGSLLSMHEGILDEFGAEVTLVSLDFARRNNIPFVPTTQSIKNGDWSLSRFLGKGILTIVLSKGQLDHPADDPHRPFLSDFLERV